MFADELRKKNEQFKLNQIAAELEQAKTKARERLNRIEEQKQRATDVINQIQEACLSRASTGYRNFEIDLDPFLYKAIKVEEDPVFLAVRAFCVSDGFIWNPIIQTIENPGGHPNQYVILKLEW